MSGSSPTFAPPQDAPISQADIFELIAVSVLAPTSWLVPQRLWMSASHLLSVIITYARPGVTRRRIERLRQNLGNEPTDRELLELRSRIMATYMEERLQILREYRPGGWRPDLRTSGLDHLHGALERGRGAILMVSPFSYADLISKKALRQAGFHISHLGAFSRGFSPNSCHVWNPTRFGMRILSPLRTRVEDRYLSERIIVPRGGGLGYARQVDRCLRGNGVISMRMGDVGHRTVELPILGGHLRLATGAPSMALANGAALLPLFVVRRGSAAFDIVIEPQLVPKEELQRHAAVEDILRRYTERLESHIRRHPYLWSGWYRLRMQEATGASAAPAPAPAA